MYIYQTSIMTLLTPCQDMAPQRDHQVHLFYWIGNWEVIGMYMIPSMVTK